MKLILYGGDYFYFCVPFYNISTVKKVPSTIIGSSPRPTYLAKDKTPGVGKYGDISYRSMSPSIGFGSESRDKPFTLKTSTLPSLGPGVNFLILRLFLRFRCLF